MQYSIFITAFLLPRSPNSSLHPSLQPAADRLSPSNPQFQISNFQFPISNFL